MPSNLPLFRFPGGVPLRAAYVWKAVPFREHMPAISIFSASPHLRYCWCCAISVFVACCSKRIFRVPSRFSIFLFVLHVSKAYSSTGRMLDPYIFSFVLVRRIINFNMLMSTLKACAAMSILTRTSIMEAKRDYKSRSLDTVYLDLFRPINSVQLIPQCLNT